MKKEFKIGELVQIRSWEDMTLEFGGHGDTYINTPRLYFLSNMRYLCKKNWADLNNRKIQRQL